MGFFGRAALRRCGSALLALVMGASLLSADATAADGPPAKELFGAKALPMQAAPASFGFYSKGCLAGGVAIPTDGPTWQAMRLSRNRRWGHPAMIALIERFSHDAVEKIGWPGLLLGDISQPRGGPMLSGHASHQIGLDADIWLTPMPQRTLSYQERETISATSMLDKNKFLTIDRSIWTPSHARLIMLAASYPKSSGSSSIPPSRRSSAIPGKAIARRSARSGRSTVTTTTSTSASSARRAPRAARIRLRSPRAMAATNRSPGGLRTSPGQSRRSRKSR